MLSSHRALSAGLAAFVAGRVGNRYAPERSSSCGLSRGGLREQSRALPSAAGAVLETLGAAAGTRMGWKSSPISWACASSCPSSASLPAWIGRLNAALMAASPRRLTLFLPDPSFAGWHCLLADVAAGVVLIDGQSGWKSHRWRGGALTRCD